MLGKPGDPFTVEDTLRAYDDALLEDRWPIDPPRLKHVQALLVGEMLAGTWAGGTNSFDGCEVNDFRWHDSDVMFPARPPWWARAIGWLLAAWIAVQR